VPIWERSADYLLNRQNHLEQLQKEKEQKQREQDEMLKLEISMVKDSIKKTSNFKPEYPTLENKKVKWERRRNEIFNSELSECSF